MTEKVSKSLKEVWEWKEACYQELKDIPQDEQLAYIEREANRILEESGIEKVPTGKNTYTLRKRVVSKVSEGTDQ